MDKSISFIDFHARIGECFYSGDESWLKTVGYREKDKDGGFRRWLEITGNNFDDQLDNFRSVVYGEYSTHKKQTEKLVIEIAQLDMFA